MLLSLSFILYGCSSSGSCNLISGPGMVQPEPDPPEPRDPVASNIIIHVNYRDFEPIVGVLVTSDIPGLIPPGTRTDANGNVPILPIDLPEGTVITLNFEKDGHVIDSVTITIGPDGVKQSDGSILYEAEATGFIPFTPDSTVKASSLYYPAFMFSWCNGIVASPDGKYLYMAYDHTHNKIVRVELIGEVVNGVPQAPQTRTIYTSNDTTQWRSPYSLALSSNGETLYASLGSSIISFDVNTNNMPATGELIPAQIAGAIRTSLVPLSDSNSVDGLGAAAGFTYIHGMVISPDGETLYVSDRTCVRCVDIKTPGDPAYGTVTTIAGSLTVGGDTSSNDDVDVSGTNARFNQLNDIVVTKDGTTLYVMNNSASGTSVANSPYKKIYKITLGADADSTLVQTICKGYTNWSFTAPTDDLAATPVTVERNGCGLALSENEDRLYVSSRRIKYIDLTKNSIPLVADIQNFVGNAGTTAYLDAVGEEANLRGAFGLTFSSDYKTLYFIDQCPHRLRAVDMATTAVTTLMGGRCGNRDADVMPLYPPKNIAISKDKNTIYFTVNDDYTSEYYIARFKQENTEFKRIAGDGTYNATNNFADNTNGLKAKFKKPTGVALSGDETILYVADTRNHRIRTVNTNTFEVGTFMGNGTNDINDVNQTFGFITAMTISKDGKYLFTAEADTESPISRGTATTDATVSVIRKIDIANGTITTIAGGNTRVHSDGIGTAAQLLSVIAMDVSPDNNYLYFTEVQNIHTVGSGDGTYFQPRLVENKYVRALSLTNYNVKTIAGGSDIFRNPTGIATSADGGFLIIADCYTIKTVTINNGAVKLISGHETLYGYEDEIGLDARFGNTSSGMGTGLFDLKLSPDGSTIFVADNGNAMIRRIVAIDTP